MDSVVDGHIKGVSVFAAAKNSGRYERGGRIDAMEVWRGSTVAAEGQEKFPSVMIRLSSV